MNIGWLISARRLDVAVARPAFDPYANATTECKLGAWTGPLGEPHSQAALCISARTLVLAGGIRRFVAPETLVGVHEAMVDPILIEKWRRTYRGTTPIEAFI